MCRFRPRLALVAGTVLALVMAPVTLRAQNDQNNQEWEATSGYYEDDAWYDISEWLDGNDYNPTNETAGVWDDESYYTDDSDYYDSYDYDDYEYYDDDDGYGFYDYGEDEDYGYDYDYDYDYGYDDYGYEYDNGYVYDYGYDDEWNELYGYDNRYGDDNWFYDYYDDGYLDYDDFDNDGSLETVSRYYDYDGDGFYDGVSTYYNTDGDDTFDTTGYYSFNDNANRSNQQRSNQQNMQDAKQQSASGTVLRTKRVSLPDGKHLVVEVETDRGKALAVDLGPTAELSEFDLQKGDDVEIRGMMTQIGNKRVLMASRLTMNGDTRQIQRKRRKFQGQITSTKRVKIRGNEHFVAIVEQNGKQRAIDLGPADSLGQWNLQQGDRITVSGPPVKVQDRVIVMAQTVTHDGKERTISRTDQRRQQGQESASRQGDAGQRQRQQDQQRRQAAFRPDDDRRQQRGSSQADGRQRQEDQRRTRREDQPRDGQISGEIVSLRTTNVRGQKRQVAELKSRRGNDFLIDLGPAEKFRADLSEGDRITAFGRLVKTSGNRPVVVASRFKTEQGTRQVTPQREGRKEQQVKGKIVSKGTATVRGQERQMITLRTNQDQQIHADLGRKSEFNADELQQGDSVTVTGTIVPNQEQPIVLASKLTHNGETFEVDRPNLSQQEQSRSQN